MDGLTPEEIIELERRRAENRLRDSRDPAVLLPAIAGELALEAKLLRVVKTNAEPVVFRVETTAGTVRLGPTTRWATRPGDFRAAFLSVGEVAPRLTRDRFDELCGMVARAAVAEDLGDEATDAGLGALWLRGYLAAHDPPADDVDEAAETDWPFMHGGAVHVTGPALKRWLLTSLAERVTFARLGSVLRAAGCEPARVDDRRDGRRQVRAWTVPPSSSSSIS